ncbi:MAG: TetR/AcrR family transcriptional regulator [Planctomycetota bacterium]
MAGKNRMNSEERRAQLVDVARRCFASNGYAHTTTAKIALMAEVSEPVLYRHFDSKLDLFHEILASTLEESRLYFAAVAAQPSNGAEKILALAVDFPRYCEANRGRFRVIERALASVEDEKSRGIIRGYYEGIVESLTRLVEEGRRDGSIRCDVAPGSLAWVFTMNGVGFCLLSALGIPEIIAPDFTTDLRRIVLGMLGYGASGQE